MKNFYTSNVTHGANVFHLKKERRNGIGGLLTTSLLALMLLVNAAGLHAQSGGWDGSGVYPNIGTAGLKDYGNGVIQLVDTVRGSTSASGAVWETSPVNQYNPTSGTKFSATYKLFFGCPGNDNIGGTSPLSDRNGDGMAFSFWRNGDGYNLTDRSTGGGLGYMIDPDHRIKMVTLEFDTWSSRGNTNFDNNYGGGTSGDHDEIALQIDGVADNTGNITAVDAGNLEDGLEHEVRIEYDPATKILSVRIDAEIYNTSLPPRFSYVYDLGNYFGSVALNQAWSSGKAGASNPATISNGTGICAQIAKPLCPCQVQITTPTAGTTLKTCDTPTIDVSVTPPAGNTVTNVEFFIDGGSIGTDNSFPYSLAFNPSTLTSAGHVLTAVATFGPCITKITSTPVNITVAAVPVAPTAGNGGAICASGTISLTATTVAGASGYNWSGPGGYTSTNQNPTITNATVAMSGVYTVTATTNGCASAGATTTVTVNARPVAPTASNSGAACVGGSVTLSATAVTGATSYNWTGQGGAYTASGQNQTLSPATLAMGSTYTVTVTTSAASGCTSLASAPTTVVVNTRPTAPTASNSGAACIGGSVTLSATAVTGATSYNWTGQGGAYTASGQNQTLSPATLAMGSTYTVTVTVPGDGCTSAASAPTTVVVNARPTAPTASNSGAACIGGSVTLSATAVTGATSYNWTGQGGAYTATGQNQTLSPATLAMGSTYTVTVTVPGDGCTSAASAATTVTVNTLPTAPVASNSGAACIGGSVTLSATAVTGATSYNWTGQGGAYTASGQNQTLSPATLAMGSTYTVTVTVPGNGCTSAASAPTTVIVNTRPTAPAASNSGAACIGGSVTLSATAVTGATSYNWTGQGGAYTASGQNQTLSPATLAMGSTYTVTVTVPGDGCTSAASAPTTVVVNTRPTAPTASNSGAACIGGSVTLSATAVTGATSYNWTGQGGAYTASGQTQTLSPATLAMGSTYTVTVTVPGDGCTSAASAATTVTVNALPTAPTASNSGAACIGGSVTLSATAVTGATSYNWTGQGGAYTASGQNQTLSPATLAMGSTYTVTVTVPGNGCTSAASAPTTVVVNTRPTAPAASNSGAACIGGSVTLSATAVTGATSYNWTGQGGAYTASGQNQTLSPATLAMGSTYTVTVTVPGDGCTSAASAPTTVVVNARPTAPTASNSGAACIGGSVTLSATAVTGATSYNWTGQGGAYTATGQNQTLSPATLAMGSTYTVTVTVPGDGCTSAASAATTVTVNTLPTAPVASNSGAACVGGSVTLSATAVTGATSYNWSGPAGYTATGQTQTRTPATTGMAGDYAVTVTVPGSGCTSAASAFTTVTVTNGPVSPVVTSNSPLCVGGTLNLSVSTVSGAIAYNWSGPNGYTASGQTPNRTPATLAMGGDYSVTVTTSGSGCTSSATNTTVVVNARPTAPTASNSGAACIGGSVTLSATAVTGATSYNWTGQGGAYTATGQNQTLSPATLAMGSTYTVTVTVPGDGCTSAASAATTVTVNTLPTAPVASNSGAACIGGSVTLSATAVTGATSYNWTGQGGAYTASGQNQTLSPATLAMGSTYTVTVTVPGDGCTSAASAATTVTVNALPIAPTASNDGDVCVDGTINLSATAVTGATSYNWSGPNGYTATGQTQTRTPATAGMAGDYKVTVTVPGSGCTSAASDVTTISVKSIPTGPTAGNSNKDTLCLTGTIQLTATSVTDAISYNWSGPNGFTSSIQNPEIPDATPLMSGLYKVTVSIAGNGCVSINPSSTNVIVNNPPQPPTIDGDHVIDACGNAIGNETLKITTGSGSGEKVQWFKGSCNGTLVHVGSSYDAPYPDVTTSYFAAYHTAGCENSTCDEVIINITSAYVEAGGGLNGIDSICFGASYKLDSAKVIPENTIFKWKVRPNTISDLAYLVDATDLNPEFVLPANGSPGVYEYFLSVQDPGCGEIKDSIIIVVNSLPKVDLLTAPDTVCINTPITLISQKTGGTKPFNFIWTSTADSKINVTKDSTFAITPDKPVALYYVQISDANGCVSNVDSTGFAALEQQELEVQNLLTPNGDGKNDTFEILDTNDKPMFAGSSLSIYNKWGDRVYRADNYNNDWNPKGVADGVYYYHLKSGCGDVEYKGWVQLVGTNN